MAINALQSAASGLSALNTALDVVAHNLANVNTPGFKASRVNYQDLLYIEKAQPGSLNQNDDQRPIGLYVGLGVKVSGTQLDVSQGAQQSTGRPLDVAVVGEGFFRVTVDSSQSPDGFGYTRAGNFALNSVGELVLANDQGRRIDPAIQVPEGATGVTIGADGTVLVTIPGQLEPTSLGPIQLSTFINAGGLKQVGENMFVPTVASGPAVTGDPGLEGRGSLQAGFLESSNVDPTRELIELIRTQRAFEMNSQSIRAADEALRAVAQLRR
jgi:flagellar basal-body rod protein FlgG